MSVPVKILTLGSAAGSIRDLFAKIQTINLKHGPFDLALCTGDFFSHPQTSSSKDEAHDADDTRNLLEGNITAPLACYIMQGKMPLPDAVIQKFAKTGGELGKNVFLLNKSGLMTTKHGLRIACLGGIYDEEIFTSSESAPGFASPFFSSHTVDKLLSSSMANSSSGQNYKSLSAIQSSSSSSQLVDVLISNVWPASVAQFSSVPLPPSNSPIGAPPVDEVVRKLKPRYHFAAVGGDSPVFWEREPFVWESESGRVSRFVSLGSFGGEAPVGSKKQRWFYAFSIAPNVPAQTRPTNATKNPFTESAPRHVKRSLDDSQPNNFIFGDVRQPAKRARVADNGEPGKPPPGYKCRRCDATDHFINDCPARDKPPEGYVCKICQTRGHFVRDCPTRHAVGDTGGKKPKEGYVCRACGSELHYLDDCPVAKQQPHHERRGKRGPPKEVGPDECWFCLSNPNLAKHLIVAIGNECYVTLPKGQIIPTRAATSPSDYSIDIPGGGHVLIVPITHFPTFATIPGEIAPPVFEEVAKYKTSLRAMFAKYKCVTVLFEIGRIGGRSVHAHVHVVPIPTSLKDKVEDAFLSEGKMMGIDFEGDPESAISSGATASGRGYFQVELPDGRKMVHLMKDGVPFSIQFGRQVLVNLMDMPDRLDWKACALSDEEDTADADAFKTAFAPFDPSG